MMMVLILTVAVLVSSVAARTTASGTSAGCCTALSQHPALPGAVVYYPETTSFTQRLCTYWSLSAAVVPWCMVLPQNAEEVSRVITTLVELDCPFVRSGGHGPFELSNSVRDGVTIDMGFFNQTTYDPASNIASIGPGAHWGPVYEALTPHGVTVTGGRATSVGVGGFLTGGGNSFHSATHGFACDQVINFKVVLANGSIVDANAQENRELWIALRGGSGNFGLVMRFDMQAIKFADPANPHIWGGVVQYNASNPVAREGIVNAFVRFADNVGSDPDSSTIVGWGYDAQSGSSSIRGYYENTANVAYPAAFDEFLKVEGRLDSTLRSETMLSITAELTRDVRTYTIWFTGTYANDARIVALIAEAHAAMVNKIEALLGAGTGMFTSCQVQPLTRAMISHGQGSNVLGLQGRLRGPGDDGENDPRPQAGIIFLIYVGLDSKEDETAALPVVRDFHESVKSYASEIGGNLGWTYLNYANGEQDPLGDYGQEAMARMRSAAELYDPEGVFRRLRGSGFRLET